MLLILMRHGIAEDGTPDEARKLTRKGRARVLLMARMLDKFDLSPDLILTSPRVRARQTAEIVARELGNPAAIDETEALDFHHGWKEFSEDLIRRASAMDSSATVLACGHQPQFGRLATAALLGEERDFEVKKASLLGLRFGGDIVAAGAALRFYMTPAMARSAKF